MPQNVVVRDGAGAVVVHRPYPLSDSITRTRYREEREEVRRDNIFFKDHVLAYSDAGLWGDFPTSALTQWFVPYHFRTGSHKELAVLDGGSGDDAVSVRCHVHRWRNSQPSYVAFGVITNHHRIGSLCEFCGVGENLFTCRGFPKLHLVVPLTCDVQVVVRSVLDVTPPTTGVNQPARQRNGFCDRGPLWGQIGGINGHHPTRCFVTNTEVLLVFLQICGVGDN